MAPQRPERTGLPRLIAALRNLAAEQRAVLLAAGVLLLTMLLPWYSRTVNAVIGGKLVQQGESKLAITVFSFVEAAIFLVALGVAVLVLARGDRRPFHLPGGDGIVVTVAGAWATFLIFYRFVDKPSGGGGAQVQVEYGLSWGIFFGLLAALALLVTGLRLRSAQLSEPVLPGTIAPSDGPHGAPPPRRRAPPPPAPEPPIEEAGADRPEAPTHHAAPRTGPPAQPRARALPPEAATRVATAAEETAATRVERPVDPGEAERAARRVERESRRREAQGNPAPAPEPPAADAPGEEPTEVRSRRDPDSFEPPEFELPPRG